MVQLTLVIMTKEDRVVRDVWYSLMADKLKEAFRMAFLTANASSLSQTDKFLKASWTKALRYQVKCASLTAEYTLGAFPMVCLKAKANLRIQMVLSMRAHL